MDFNQTEPLNHKVEANEDIKKEEAAAQAENKNATSESPEEGGKDAKAKDVEAKNAKAMAETIRSNPILCILTVLCAALKFVHLKFPPSD